MITETPSGQLSGVSAMPRNYRTDLAENRDPRPDHAATSDRL